MGDKQTPAEQFAAGMMEASDALAAIIEAVAGHRAKLEQAGFSPTMAELGAMHMHQALITNAFAQVPR